MRLLRSKFDVDTRFGGRFVQSIDGLKGAGAGGREDWFFFVNGVESTRAPPSTSSRPGDRVQWDYRPWDDAAGVPAIVGAFPEPFLHGLEGRRRPVRVECEDAAPLPATRRVRLDAAGVPTAEPRSAPPPPRRSCGSWWPPGRRPASCAARPTSSAGRSKRRVRPLRGGRAALELLDESGDVARTVRPGDGTALVVALRPRADELVWLVTGLDDDALEAGARALTERRLRDAFAVAVTGDEVEKLPLESP